MVSTLAPNGDTVVVNTESLPKHIQDTAEIMSTSHDTALPDDVTKTYVEKGATDILQQDQQLECVSEEEISTTVHEGIVCFSIRSL